MASAASKDRARAPEETRSVPNEVELDAPSRQTLWLLGIMAATTLVMWVLGRVACNYHVPGESLTPRALTVEERSKSAKDAAIEFARAIEAGDFASARLVATGAALASLDSFEKACADCPARTSSKQALRAVAVVEEEDGKEGYVRVVVRGGARGEQKSLLHVARGGKFFQVTEVLALDAKVPNLVRSEPKLEPKHSNPIPPMLRRPAEHAATGDGAAPAPGSSPAPTASPAESAPTKP